MLQLEGKWVEHKMYAMGKENTSQTAVYLSCMVLDLFKRSNLCQKIISKNKIFRTSRSIFLYFKRLSNGLQSLRCSNIESCHQLKLSHELTIRYGDFTGKPIHFIYLGIQVYSSHWLVTAFCYLLWHSSKGIWWIIWCTPLSTQA